MHRRGKIILVPINDICDFSMILYRFIRGGTEMDELYSLFNNQEPFQYKIINSSPDESTVERCMQVLKNKLAIAEKIYDEGCNSLHFDQIGAGDTLWIDPLFAYIRKLEKAKENVCQDNVGGTLEQKLKSLQVNLGTFEATCSAAAGKIGTIAQNKNIKLVVSRSAIDR